MSGSKLPARAKRRYPAVLASLIWLLYVSPVAAANNLAGQGGPTMQNPVKVYLIYWQPTGVIFDKSVANGVGNFETLIQRLVADISASSYLNIVTQYPGSCSFSASGCVLKNISGSVTLGGSWVDTRGYPVHNKFVFPQPRQGGTQADPLTDADIQNEVTRAISQNHWSNDSNSIFFVLTGLFKNTGKPVEECRGINCTFKGNVFCGYHWSFASNGANVLYSYLSDASFSSAGCGEGIVAATNGQIASDRQVALLSHEFFEALTDPLVNVNSAWVDPATGNEIGDNCNQISSVISMNGNNYAVQQQWSNASSSCVTSFDPAFSQITFKVVTGGDDLRGDSSATVVLNVGSGKSTVTLKDKDAGSWGNNSSNTRTFPLNPPQPLSAFGNATLTLQSHSSIVETDDNWNVEALNVILSRPGGQICFFQQSGNPFVRLTGSSPSVTLRPQNGC